MDEPQELGAGPAAAAAALHLQHRFARMSPAERRACLLDTVVPSVAVDAPEKGAVSDAVAVLLSCIRYKDKQTRIALQTAIRKLARAAPNAFVGRFLQALCRHGKAHADVGSASTVAVWIAQFVRHRAAALREAGAVDAVLDAQAACLHVLETRARERVAAPVFGRVCVPLLVDADILELYLAKVAGWSADKRHGGGVAMLVALVAKSLFTCEFEKKAALVGAYKECALSVFVEGVLLSKERKNALLLSQWNAVLEALGHGEMADALLPAIDRALKRSPASSVHVVQHAMGTLSLDLSRYAATGSKPLGPMLFALFLSSDAVVCGAAADAFVLLAKNCSDRDAFTALVTILTDCIAVKKNKPEIKINACRALEAMTATSLSPAAVEEVSASTLAALIRLIAAEGNERVSMKLVSCLASWMGVAPPSALPSAVDCLAAGLKKAAGSRHFVECVADACTRRDHCQALRPLEGELKRLASPGKTHASRVSSLIAARTLVLMALHARGEADEGESPVAALLAPFADAAHFTAARSFHGQLGEEDALAVVRACTDILANHLQQLAVDAADPLRATPLFVCMAALGVHASWRVRHAAKGAYTTLLAVQAPAGCATMADGLLSGLYEFVCCGGAAAEAADADAGAEASTSDGGGGDAAASCALPSLCAESVSETHRPLWVLLSFHARVAGDAALARRSYARRFEQQSGAWLPVRTAGALRFLLGDRVVLHADGEVQRACARAMAHLLPLSHDDTVVEELTTLLRGRLHTEELAALTEKERAILETPEGEVCSYVDKDAPYVPEVVKEAAAKVPKSEKKLYGAGAGGGGGKSGGGRGGKGAGRGAAKGGKGGAAKGAPRETEQERLERLRVEQVLADESATRARVRAAIDSCQRTLAIIAQTLHHEVDSSLGDGLAAALWECLRVLAAVPEVAEAARLAVFELYRWALRAPCGFWVARATAVAVLGMLSESDLPHAGTTMERITAEVERVSVSRGAVLPPRALLLLYPVVQQSVRHTVAFRTQERAVSIVVAHADSVAADFPVGPVFHDMLHLVACSPRLEERAQDVLVRIASHLTGRWCHAGVRAVTAGLLHEDKKARLASAKAAAALPVLGADGAEVLGPELFEHLTMMLWTACGDEEQQDELVAMERAWQRHGMYVLPSFFEHLAPLLRHELAVVRAMAGRAIASAARELAAEDGDGDRADAHPVLVDVLERLKRMYCEALPPPPDPTAVRVERADDTGVVARTGVAAALLPLMPVLHEAQRLPLLSFLMHAGGPFHDADATVRQAMSEAGVALVHVMGERDPAEVLQLLETYLYSETEKVPARVKETIVVLLGSIASHLSAADELEKVVAVMEMLLDAVTSASNDSVRNAVADCLIPLAKSIKGTEAAAKLVDQTVEMLAHKAWNENERRGVAYGLAGLVTGLRCYKSMEVNVKLDKYMKGSVVRKCGALYAYEALCTKMGRLFMPYVVMGKVLTLLLRCLGDSNELVREAASSTSRAIMEKLGNQDVKLVVRSILKVLEDEKWRTKVATTLLLGSMAFCAPKQLSLCLPDIVPKLQTLIFDSHPEVHAAARQALKQIGSVIRNPEIAVHVPLIIEALDDPSKHTGRVLDALLHTNYVHVVDAPSLALIVPVIERGLKDRATGIKRSSAQIVGNMATLCNHRDLEPYIDSLLPLLRKMLSDPSPDGRTVAASALGHLVNGMGEEKFPELVAWLMAAMKSEASTVERSGAAQGLAHVLGALPSARIAELLPTVFRNANSVHADVREGAVSLFVFLPSTVGARLTEYLPHVMPIILSGIADDSDPVRDASMRAGQAIVNEFGVTSLKMLLPCLEEGLFDSNWRIRQSSVQLMGDLLIRLTGVDEPSGTPGHEDSADGDGAAEDELAESSGDRDEMRSSGADRFTRAQNANRALSEALGEERRRSVLAALYIVRADTSPVVRQRSLLVWKSVVQNTPKTLKEILPVLTSKMIECLGSDDPERRAVASKTLGDLVRKMASTLLPTVMPVLHESLASPSATIRQGACLGLTEVIRATPNHQLVSFSGDLVTAVRDALGDEDDEVREAAAEAFEQLSSFSESQALEEVLPSLLRDMQSDDDEVAGKAQAGLAQILGVQSHVVLPHLVPQLLAPPLSASNCQALVAMADVSGAAVHRYLSQIFDALVPLVVSDENAAKAAHAVALSVDDDDGLHFLMLALVPLLKHDEAEVRSGAARVIAHFCKNTRIGYDGHLVQLLAALFPRLADRSEGALKDCHAALASVLSSIPKDKMVGYIPTVRKEVKSLVAALPAGESLPGFSVPARALQPFLPLILHGLRFGAPETREVAARTLGDVIRATSAVALKPFVVTIIGSLIRVISDRFPSEVKIAILQTMGLILEKAGASCKSFVTQLQTTFVKALNDTSSGVREEAAANLGLLMQVSVRIDPLVNDIVTGVGSGERGVKHAMLRALGQVLLHASSSPSEKCIAQVELCIESELAASQGESMAAIAQLCGAFAKVSPADRRAAFITTHTLGPSKSWEHRHQQTALLASILLSCAKVLDEAVLAKVGARVKEALEDDRVTVQEAGLECVRALLLAHDSMAWDECGGAVLPAVVELARSGPSDVQLRAIRAIKLHAKVMPEETEEQLPKFVAALMEHVRGKALRVRLAAERAMVHCIRMKAEPARLERLLGRLDAALKKSVSEYCARVLARLPADSDDEDDVASELRL